MSAEIDISCPSLNYRKRVWIEQMVSRLGSDTDCEILIPSSELAPHAFNLVYDSGQYTVIAANESGGKLNGIEVTNQRQLGWANGGVLACADNVTLTMVIQGDPAPSRAPVADVEDDNFLPPESDNEPTESAADPANSSDQAGTKNLVTILVIVACFLGVGWMLFPDLLGSPSSKTQERIVAPRLIEVLQFDQVSDNLKESVRYATVSKLRSDIREARKRFSLIRDAMMVSAEYDQFGLPPQEGESQKIKELRGVFYYVRDQLLSLR